MRSDLCSLIRSSELVTICSGVTQLTVGSDTCNDEWLTVLDMTSILSLKRLRVGDHSFAHVKEVKLIGLNELESVVIGENCFTKCMCCWSSSVNPNRHFQLKNCLRVRELKIGCGSFSAYSLCEIENLPSLEVIEMGELNRESLNYQGASLEWKSDSQREIMVNKLASFEVTPVLPCYAFFSSCRI